MHISMQTDTETQRHKDRRPHALTETNRQTEIKDRQTDRQTDRHSNKNPDTETEIHITHASIQTKAGTGTDRQMHPYKQRHPHSLTQYIQTKTGTDRQTDRQTNASIQTKADTGTGTGAGKCIRNDTQ